MLKAATEIVGGEKELAARFGVSETLLSKFMDDTLELPDKLLLRAVDIILEHRHSRLGQLWSPAPALKAGPAQA